ncbi:hypothetical protein LBMAG42_56070 [Deltaproteobacteria bacterium]|nr:hypothetical protein LBMAG42_56070 [Deltaproteobacteria bacterium]
MTLGQIVNVRANEAGGTRPGIVAKIVGETVNVKVLTEGKPERDPGVSPALVKQGERRVDSLFLVGVTVGEGLGCILAESPAEPPASPQPPKPERPKGARRSGV